MMYIFVIRQDGLKKAYLLPLVYVFHIIYLLIVGETLPVDLAVRESTTKACMHIPCPLDACVHQECLKFPDASCR